MGKMKEETISAAKAAADLTIRLNQLDAYEDHSGENALATLVISLANHIEALEEEAEGAEQAWGLTLEKDNKLEFVWYLNKEARDRGFTGYTEQFSDTIVKKIKRVWG
jgi:hypothetical protein